MKQEYQTESQAIPLIDTFYNGLLRIKIIHVISTISLEVAIWNMYEIYENICHQHWTVM